MLSQRQKASSCWRFDKARLEIKKGRNTFARLHDGKWRRCEGALENHLHLLHRIKASSRCEGKRRYDAISGWGSRKKFHRWLLAKFPFIFGYKEQEPWVLFIHKALQHLNARRSQTSFHNAQITARPALQTTLGFAFTFYTFSVSE